ncbi:MAG: thiamine phosphate synthase [Dehalococcoidia bacterium]|nr:thiamine phosphate synthase [Dehalococcoidia bacterium]
MAVAVNPRLLVVADLAYAGSAARLLDVIEALAPVVEDPRVAVQLRAKAVDAACFERLAEATRRRVPAEAALVLNGDAALAARLGYDGAHWPEEVIPAHRPEVPRWHSAAVHSLEALRRAEDAGMGAAVFGAVFAPGSKAGEAAGLDALRAIAGAARLPVLAIGGVTPDRVAVCIEAGAHGVGVVSGVLGHPDPAEAVREYLAAIEPATRESKTR